MPSKPDRELTVVFCLFLVLFLGVADNQILSPLLPSIRKQVGKSSSDMGLLFTGYSLSAGLSVLLWGPLSDLYGRKAGLLVGLSVFSLGSIVCFLSQSYSLLLGGRIITGMGASMLSLNAISYAADYFPYSRRGWAMGSILSSYFAALILGVPLGSWLGDLLGWNAVFGVTAGLGLILVATTRASLPRLPHPGAGGMAELLIVQRVKAYLAFLKTRKTVGALFSSFLASAGTMGFLAFLGVWLHDAFGISGKKVGLVFLASGAAALLASPFAGHLSDLIGKRIQFVISNLALAGFLLFLPRLQWGFPLFFLFCAISLAAAFRQGPMEALLTECVGPGSRGSFIALKNSFSQLGIAIAAFVSGILFERVGYSAVCLLGAAANVLAAAGILFLVREHNL
jgi:predicted MFS family arabinose efflux permease